MVHIGYGMGEGLSPFYVPFFALCVSRVVLIKFKASNKYVLAKPS